MAIVIQPAPSLPADADATGIGVYADRLSEGEVAAPLSAAFLSSQGFAAKPGESCVVSGENGQLVVALGLGSSGEATPRTFRRAAAALARAAHRQGRLATTLVEQAPERLDRAEVAQAVAEGVILGAYRFTELKSEPEPSHIGSVAVAGGQGPGIDQAMRVGTAVGQAVCLARDLVNQPGGSLTPRAFADRAMALADAGGFTAEVLDRDDIAREGLGGLLGVNRGSTEPPRFVKLAWEPESPSGTLALVGKGITFDSGGLSLKTNEGMQAMKADMAGAAAVLGAFSGLDAVRPPVRVLGFLPLTDNMPGGDATRVGDVLRIRNGTTVEVLNTDAEGRLILADALALASEARPDAIVDLATLTGACMVGLGLRTAGLMGNDDGFVGQVRRAADVAGEDVWPLPLPDELRRQLDSEVADLKNVTGKRWGGALSAGAFLREFVGDGIPWAHLDIAGPAETQDDDVETRKGGTGFGVRTLLRLTRDFPEGGG